MGIVEPFRFSAEEHRTRLEAVRGELGKRGWEGLLLAGPENIYYLSGLRHFGYFAETFLIVPVSGTPMLVARAVEAPTIESQCVGIRHVAYVDGENISARVRRALIGAGLDGARVGVESQTMAFPPRLWTELRESTPRVDWVDGSGVVEAVSCVKSPAEVSLIRGAAEMTDRGLEAGALAVKSRARVNEVAAEVMAALIRAGSDHPGFPPLVRLGDLLECEHVTWDTRAVDRGDFVFMEVSGSAAG